MPIEEHLRLLEDHLGCDLPDPDASGEVEIEFDAGATLVRCLPTKGGEYIIAATVMKLDCREQKNRERLRLIMQQQLARLRDHHETLSMKNGDLILHRRLRVDSHTTTTTIENFEAFLNHAEGLRLLS